MAFLIKLFCGNEIRREIQAGNYLRSADAIKLNETVDKIFTDNHWKSGSWESAKKSAIKDLLKDALEVRKKDLLPSLLMAAKFLIKVDDISLLTPKAANDLTARLRGASYQIYSPHEVAYFLRNISAFERSFAENGIIAVDDTDNIAEYKDSFQKEQNLKTCFEQFHDATSAIHKGSKEYFESLTKHISKSTKLLPEDIDREVYRLTFGTQSDHRMSHKEVLKELKHAPLERRLQACRKLAGFAQLFSTIESLSSKQIRNFKQISQGIPLASIQKETLDLYRSFLNKFAVLHAGDHDHTLYEPLVERLTKTLQEKFDPATLKALHKDYWSPLKEAYSGKNKAAQFEKLIPYLHTISNESAKRIHEVLKSPSEDDALQKLSILDQKDLMFLYHLAITQDGQGQEVDLTAINWELVQKYSSYRDDALDRAIITELFKQYKSPLFVKLFGNVMTQAYNTYDQQATAKAVEKHIDLDDRTGYEPIIFSESPSPKLFVNKSFFQDYQRMPDIEILLPKTNRLMTIQSQPDGTPKADDPLLQSLCLHLYEFTGGDNRLFQILQTLLGQGVKSEIVNQARSAYFNQILGLPEEDTSLSRFMQFVDPTKQSLKFLSETKVEVTYQVNLTFKDTSNLSEEAKALSVMISLEKCNNEWIMSAPKCTIQDPVVSKAEEVPSLLEIQPERIPVIPIKQPL